MAEHKLTNYKCSSSFTVLWSLAQTILPGEVIGNFTDFIQQLDLLHIDAAGSIDPDHDSQGHYSIDLDGQEFVYHDAELAPPCGVCTENYTR